jgi:exosortase
MNEPKSNELSWNPGQKLGAALLGLLSVGWFSAAVEWRATAAGKASYLLLLVALGLMLYFLDRKVWTPQPNKGLFFALLAAWLALFHFFGNSLFGYVHSPSLFRNLYEAYNNPNPAADDGHGNFIPFLVAGLYWWKRRELLALPLKIWWPGLLLLVFAIGLHILGYVIGQPRLSVIALFAGIYGSMGLTWGREWLRKSAFPFFLFVFCIPLGGQANFITFPLQQLVSWLVEVVAHWLLGIDVVRVGTQLFSPLGAYSYDVQAPCSGIRSLVAIFLLTTIYGFLRFHSSWKRLLVMGLAFPFAVVGNMLRVLLIIVAAEMGGQEAGRYVHENTVISLIPYLPAFLGVVWVGGWLEKRQKPEGKARA